MMGMEIGLAFGKMFGHTSIGIWTGFRASKMPKKRHYASGAEEQRLLKLKGMVIVGLQPLPLVSSVFVGAGHVNECQWTAQHLPKRLPLGEPLMNFGGRRQGVNSRPLGNAGHPKSLRHLPKPQKRLWNLKGNINGRGPDLVLPLFTLLPATRALLLVHLLHQPTRSNAPLFLGLG